MAPRTDPVSSPLVGMVKAGFNFHDETKRSRYLVKFFQIYYTVDVDAPGSAHAMLADDVTLEDTTGAMSGVALIGGTVLGVTYKDDASASRESIIPNGRVSSEIGIALMTHLRTGTTRAAPQSAVRISPERRAIKRR